MGIQRKFLPKKGHWRSAGDIGDAGHFQEILSKTIKNYPQFINLYLDLEFSR